MDIKKGNICQKQEYNVSIVTLTDLNWSVLNWIHDDKQLD